MAAPDYFDPERLEDVIGLLGRYGEDAKVVAGGQSLMVMLRQGLIAPSALIDLHRVPDLAGVAKEGDGVRIGAMTTIHALETHPTIRARYPTLAQAAAAVGPFQIRNMGTLAGSLAHNALGADPPPALLALDAVATVAGPAGERPVPIPELLAGYYATALEPDEVITAITVPPPPANAVGGYLKFASRAVDMAIVSVAVVLTRANGRIVDARVAIGGAAPNPFRARTAEEHLRGAPWTTSVLQEAGEAAAEEAAPLGDIHASADYRRWLVRVLVPRALAGAAGGNGSGGGAP